MIKSHWVRILAISVDSFLYHNNIFFLFECCHSEMFLNLLFKIFFKKEENLATIIFLLKSFYNSFDFICIRNIFVIWSYVQFYLFFMFWLDRKYGNKKLIFKLIIMKKLFLCKIIRFIIEGKIYFETLKINKNK